MSSWAVSSDVASAGSDVWWSLPRRLHGLPLCWCARSAEPMPRSVVIVVIVDHHGHVIMESTFRTWQMQCVICEHRENLDHLRVPSNAPRIIGSVAMSSWTHEFHVVTGDWLKLANLAQAAVQDAASVDSQVDRRRATCSC